MIPRCVWRVATHADGKPPLPVVMPAGFLRLPHPTSRPGPDHARLRTSQTRPPLSHVNSPTSMSGEPDSRSKPYGASTTADPTRRISAALEPSRHREPSRQNELRPLTVPIADKYRWPAVNCVHADRQPARLTTSIATQRSAVAATRLARAFNRNIAGRGPSNGVS